MDSKINQKNTPASGMNNTVSKPLREITHSTTHAVKWCRVQEAPCTRYSSARTIGTRYFFLSIGIFGSSLALAYFRTVSILHLHPYLIVFKNTVPCRKYFVCLLFKLYLSLEVLLGDAYSKRALPHDVIKPKKTTKKDFLYNCGVSLHCKTG